MPLCPWRPLRLCGKSLCSRFSDHRITRSLCALCGKTPLSVATFAPIAVNAFRFSRSRRACPCSVQTGVPPLMWGRKNSEPSYFKNFQIADSSIWLAYGMIAEQYGHPMLRVPCMRAWKSSKLKCQRQIINWRSRGLHRCRRREQRPPLRAANWFEARDKA